MSQVHILPVGETHNEDALDCWCCPVYYFVPQDEVYGEDKREMSRTEAAALFAVNGSFIICHRSQDETANDVTGPVPWMS